MELERLTDGNGAIYGPSRFVIATMLYIMADFGRSQQLSGGECDPENVKATLRHIVPLLLNGLRCGANGAAKSAGATQ